MTIAGLPLHPLLVHFPLGLAMLCLFLVPAVTALILRRRWPSGVWFGVTFLVLAGCGSSSGNDNGDSPNTGPESSAPWTDTAMQSLVTTRCATSGCHDGSQSPKYKGIAEAAMKSSTKALSEVNRGRMPRGSSLSDAEKTTFQAFYKN